MKNRLIISILLLWAGSAFPQNYLDVIRPFEGMSGRSGSESGLAPAARASSNALLGNPALLSSTEQSFVAGDLSLDRVEGISLFNSRVQDDVQSNSLHFNSLTYIHPVSVYRGSWVWGLNIQPVNSFGRISQFSDFDPDLDFYYTYKQEETGSLYAFTAGTAILATMKTSLGFALSYLNGRNSYIKIYEETDPSDFYTFDRFLDSLHFAPSYQGVSARLGLLTELSDRLNLGVSVELPSRISVTETASQDSIEWFDGDVQNIISHNKWMDLEYVVRGPWRLGVGLGMRANPLEASINYRFHSFRTSSLSSDLYDPEDGSSLESQVTEQVSDYLQNVHEFSASLLWSLAPLDLTVAASIMNDPRINHFDNNIRLDLGMGYQLSSGLGFTLAFRHEQQQGDLNHTLESGVDRNVVVDNNFSKFQFGIKYIL